MQDLKNDFPSSLLMLLILIVGSIYLFADSMYTYPSFLHAWTQSDRLALAMNFQENGFDFFHPATYNLLTSGGITQVDFPIHDYLVAVLGKLFGSDLVFTFRIYNLLYSILGLFFLFRLCIIAGLSGIRSVFLTSFFFTLPFFVYYQNGFLPTVPSFANLIIGLFYLHKYWASKAKSQLIIAAIFLTIAALARIPFTIFLFATILLLYWNQFRRKAFKILEPFPFLIGLGLVIGYHFYNQYLGATYGSMFLQDFLYINSFENLMNIIHSAVDRFGNHFMSPFHAVLLITLLIACLKSIYNTGNIVSSVKNLSKFLLISSVGIILFFILMGNQFIDHDYYYIDTFLPLLIFISIVAFKQVKITRTWYTPVASICLIFFFYFFSFANNIQQERYTPGWNDQVEYAYSIYNNATNDFENWGVKPTDTLTILDAYSTNIPFTVFKTKGYTSLNSGIKSVKSILKKPTNYVALIDSFFRTDTYRDFPGIINELELINTNQEISLYKLDKDQDGPSDFFRVFHFATNFDFDNTRPNYKYYNGFENRIKQDGNKSFQINPDNEYNLTYHDTLKNLDLENPLRIMIVADYHQIDISKIQLVVQYGDYYHAYYTQNTLTEIDSTVTKTYKWSIPKEKLKDNQQIKIYYWNQDKLSVNIDNYNLIIYQ